MRGGSRLLWRFTQESQRERFVQSSDVPLVVGRGGRCGYAAGPGRREQDTGSRAAPAGGARLRQLRRPLQQLEGHAPAGIRDDGRRDSVFISDLDAFESLEEPALRKLREEATARNLTIHVGTWSVCPTSKAFRPANGSAAEQLSQAIRTARLVGSPVARVVLGTWEDRLPPGSIGRHIDSLVAVLKGGRSEALDAGVKIAVENHAGDMRSEELAAVVEMAGRDFVGVNYDSGNSLWTLENPVDALETLAPYIVTTSLRDGVVTEIPTGCRVKWTAMGDGQVDFVQLHAALRRAVPGRADPHRDHFRRRPRRAVPRGRVLVRLAAAGGAEPRALHAPDAAQGAHGADDDEAERPAGAAARTRTQPRLLQEHARPRPACHRRCRQHEPAPGCPCLGLRSIVLALLAPLARAPGQRRSRQAAQHRLHPHRRPSLRRARLHGTSAGPDAEHGRAREGRRAHAQRLRDDGAVLADRARRS